MKITNTTNNDINVTIGGTDYSLPAGGEIVGVPAKDAEYWVTKLHQFLICEPEKGEEGEVVSTPHRVADIERAVANGDLDQKEAEVAKTKADAEAKKAEADAKKVAKEAAKKEEGEKVEAPKTKEAKKDN